MRCTVTFSLMVLALTACGSTPSTDIADEMVPPRDLVGDCQSAKAESTAVGAKLATVPATDTAFGDYRRFLTIRATWDDANHACEAQGTGITERARIAVDTRKTLDSDEATYVSRATVALVQADKVEAARELLMLRFQSGRKLDSDQQDAAYQMSTLYNNRLSDAFQTSKTYAEMGELETTCIFSRQQFDPANDQLAKHHASVFGGEGDVHALCRLPLPASKYGGDAATRLTVVLDTDQNTSNGFVNEQDLGPVDDWKETRFFRARFSVPQGVRRDIGSAYYHVRLKVDRTSGDDEIPVSNSFWWFAD